MEYRRLGNSGLQVSAVGLGTNTFGRYADEAQAARIVNHALDVGVTFIDTADTYGRGVSEDFIGKALKGRRHEAIIGTKVGMAMGQGPNQDGVSRQRIIQSVNDSLHRLGTDYIDLYQMHRADPNTPIEETLRALDDLVRQGKVRYIGASQHAAWQIVEAIWTARANSLNSFVSVQPPYNLLNRGIDRELLPMCQTYGIGIIPYTPLAGGFLTGKYRRGEPVPEGVRGYNNPFFGRTLNDRNYDLLEALEGFAQTRGHSVGDLAMAWLLARPMVSTVITGATRPEQIEENAKSIEWKLTEEDMAELDRITRTE